MRSAALIREGAFTFPQAGIPCAGAFSIIVMAVIFFVLSAACLGRRGRGQNLLMVFAYLCGTVLSALAGYVGISIRHHRQPEGGHAREIHPEIFYGGFRGGGDGHGRHRHFSRGRGAHLYHLP